MNEYLYKFRGKDIVTGEWIRGQGILVKDKRVWIYDKQSFYWKEVEPKTVGQYINSKDKNHIEIYTGDIVKVIVYNAITDKTENFITEVLEDYAGYFPFTLNVKEGIEIVSTEILGNIYDNIELLDYI